MFKCSFIYALSILYRMESDDVANVFKNQSDHKAQLDGLTILLDTAFPTTVQLDLQKLEALVQSGIFIIEG